MNDKINRISDDNLPGKAVEEYLKEKNEGPNTIIIHFSKHGSNAHEMIDGKFTPIAVEDALTKIRNSIAPNKKKVDENGT
jgi:hypothetical protein